MDYGLLESMDILEASQLKDFPRKLKEAATIEFKRHKKSSRMIDKSYHKCLTIWFESIPLEWVNRHEFILAYSHVYLFPHEIKSRFIDHGIPQDIPSIEENLYKYKEKMIIMYKNKNAVDR